MTRNIRQNDLSSHLIQPSVRTGLIIALLIASGMEAMAQTASRPDRGTRGNVSYSVSDIENISLTNGNVNLSIPLASLPPMAGGNLSLALRAVYNSKLWDTTRYETKNDPLEATYVVTQPQASNLGGWRMGYMYSITVHNAREDYDWVPPPMSDPDYNYLVNNGWWKVILTTPDGAQHELRPLDYSPFPISGLREHLRGYYSTAPHGSVAMRYYSFDGSYLYAVLNQSGSGTTWTVYEKDGTRIVQYSSGIQRIYDTNGNSIKVYTNSDPGTGLVGTYYQDEVTEREIRYVYNPAGGGGGGACEIQYQTVGGNWVSIELQFGSTLVQGKVYHRENPDCLDQAVILPNTSMTVLRTIILPQTQPSLPGRQFSFSYNSDADSTVSASDSVRLVCGSTLQTYSRTASFGWGSLSQIITPVGSVVNYTYSLNDVHYLNDSTYEVNEMTREPVMVKTVDHDGITDTWDFTISSGGGTVEGPDGSVVTEQMYPHDLGTGYYLAGSTGKGGLVYRSVRSAKVVVERHWTLMPFTGSHDKSPGGQVSFNPVVDAEYTTLMEGETAVKMSAKTFQHDFNGNVTQTTEYDWFDPSLVILDTAGVPTGVPGSATALRTTTNSHYNDAPAAGSANIYANRALSTVTPLILSAPRDTITGPSQMRFSYDGQAWNNPPTVGNLTRASIWNDQDSVWLDTVHTYDSYGNRLTTVAPKGVATTGDANDFITTFTWDTATHANITQVSVDPRNGTGAQTASVVYDYSAGLPTSQTDVNGKLTTIDYTNQLLGTTDPFLRPGKVSGPAVNSVVGGVTYTNQRHQVRSLYYDQAHQMVVESDLNTEADRKLKARSTTDQLGRVTLTESNEDGTATWTISSQTVYIQAGKITKTSNPKRTAAVTTDGWTRATRDNLGRVTEVATFATTAQPPDSGGTTGNPNWSGSVNSTYYANETTVADQAGKQRKSVTDGLGRLLEVYEDPAGLNYETSYQYDTLNNLRKVTQGAQHRFFMYNSLSRLIRARNPEQVVNTPALDLTDPTTGNSQWAMKYTYDENSNLATKVDARDFTTTYSYDGLNRNTTVGYSDSTPGITRAYDTATLGKGRLQNTETAGGAGSRVTINAYDAMGRPLSQGQQFFYLGAWGSSYIMQQAYNLAGGVSSQTYPSGRTTTTNYDAAGRLSSFSGNLGDGVQRTYADTFSYAAGGMVTKERFGTATALYHRLHYNNRQQLYDIRLGTGTTDNLDDLATKNRGALHLFYNTDYAFGDGGASNNGNVYRADHLVPLDENFNSWVDSVSYYNYDELNRLASVDELPVASWVGGGGLGWLPQPYSQRYNYDPYGNRTINTGATWGIGINRKAFTANIGNNQLEVPAGQSGVMSYDKAGNLTNDTYTGAGARVYDAENRMISAVGNGNNSYVYDGDGRRVRRIVNGVETWQVYGIGGELLAEYPANGAANMPQTEYGYRNGQLLIVVPCDGVIRWLVTDHLGTPRMEVDGTGSLSGMKRHDYLPFGEELPAGMGARSASSGYTTDCVRQRYTGQEHDDETELDFMQARYYGSMQGRFTSVDPITVTPGRIADPQQFNLYAYVRNNPLTFVDPTGMVIDVSRLSEEDLQKWGEVVKIANLKDAKGNYVNPELQKTYQKLQDDSRIFFIENKDFGKDSGTVGQFDVWVTNGATDFTHATIQLDFNKIYKRDTVSQSDIIPDFKKFEGLIGKDQGALRLAEVFGHEGAHGIFALNDPAKAVEMQFALINRDWAMADLGRNARYPYPPDVMQKMEAAAKFLGPTELFAQQREQIFSGELRATVKFLQDQKKQQKK